MNHYFKQHANQLHAEDVALTDVAKKFGTPTYVYSQATLQQQVKLLQQGMQQLDHLLCYAVKANSNLALLQILQHMGCGFDAVSLGELCKVHKIGAQPQTVIMSGVGKTNDEIAAALRANVLYICIESIEELQAVSHIAQQMGVQASICMRVNPHVDAQTHPYIATALKESKFGIPIEAAWNIYREITKLSHIKLIGVSCHIGSQITSMAPFVTATQHVANLAKTLLQAGAPLTHVGIGGGLGITYHNESPPHPLTYGQTLAPILAPLQLKVVLEPGRFLVGQSGILLTRVVRLKQTDNKLFVLVDAGMNDLLRPALYQAYHTIEPVTKRKGPQQVYHIAGPVCESADVFAQDRLLPPLLPDDLLVIYTAGAYGFAMASHYNARLRPAEVLCHGQELKLVRARDTYADLWHGEYFLDGTTPDLSFLKGNNNPS